jgi:hypothetical protein
VCRKAIFQKNSSRPKLARSIEMMIDLVTRAHLYGMKRRRLVIVT